MMDMSYQSASGKLEEQASNDRTEQLGNPIQNTSKEGDVASNKGTKSNGRVDMSTRNVSTNRDSHKQCKAMSQ